MTNERVYMCIRVLEDGEHEKPTHFRVVDASAYEDAIDNLSLAEEGLKSAMQELEALKRAQERDYLELCEEHGRMRDALQKILTGKTGSGWAVDAQSVALEVLGNIPPSAEPLQQQSGVDFDKDLVRLDGIRKTMADMRRYSLQGVPQREVEFLLSFIDNLWREYSRANASHPLREEGPAASIAALVAQGAEYCGNWPCRLLKYHTGPCQQPEGHAGECDPLPVKSGE